MKCHYYNCKNEVEHPDRNEWYGLCDKCAKREEKRSYPKKHKPLFTTKHYKAIEKYLNVEINNKLQENYTFEEIVDWFIAIFSNDNPRFSWLKFKKSVYKNQKGIV